MSTAALACATVTLAGTPVRGAMNVRCDNDLGIRALVRHLVIDHGYDTLGYLEQNVSPRLALECFLLEARRADGGGAL